MSEYIENPFLNSQKSREFKSLRNDFPYNVFFNIYNILLKVLIDTYTAHPASYRL